jgi:hypothetical protein
MPTSAGLSGDHECTSRQRDEVLNKAFAGAPVGPSNPTAYKHPPLLTLWCTAAFRVPVVATAARVPGAG